MGFGGVQVRWAGHQKLVQMTVFINFLVGIQKFVFLQHIECKIGFRGCPGKVGRTPKSSSNDNFHYIFNVDANDYALIAY